MSEPRHSPTPWERSGLPSCRLLFPADCDVPIANFDPHELGLGCLPTEEIMANIALCQVAPALFTELERLRVTLSRWHDSERGPSLRDLRHEVALIDEALAPLREGGAG